MAADVGEFVGAGIELEHAGFADDLLLFFDDLVDGELAVFDEGAGEGGFDFVGGEALGGTDQLFAGEVVDFGIDAGVVFDGFDHGIELLFDFFLVGKRELEDSDFFFQFHRKVEDGGDDDEGLGAATKASGEVAEEPDDARVLHVGVEVAEDEESVFGGFVDLGESFEFAGEAAGFDRSAGAADGGLHALGDGPGVKLALEFFGDLADGVFDPSLLP